METVVHTPADELNLLTAWGDPDEPSRRRRAAVGTLAVHVLAIAVLLAIPNSWFYPPPPQAEPEHHITPIFMPLTPLTQKAPNTEKASKQFRDSAASPPQPKATAPPAPPPSPQPIRQASIPPPPPKQVQQTPPPPIEPPQIDTAVRMPKVELPTNGLPLPPAPKPQQSQIPLENLGGPAPVVPPDQRKLAMPDTSVESALRNIRSTPPAPTIGGSGQAPKEALPQLLSDAQGVDFTYYLRIILQIVTRNWNNIMPASARMGRRGTTSVVFSIERLGNVGKLVIAQHAGTDAYDNAAISSVSASQPFPPLPTAFKGNEIRVQFNFEYNKPKQ